MTEYAIPLDDLTEFKGETIVSPDVETSIDFVNMDISETLPRVDAARGVFITSRNEAIELANKPVSYLIVHRIQSEGKPKIPQIEVTLLGKHKQLEYFPGHEGYKARLAEWEDESQIALMRYLFVVGTKGEPPQEFVDEQAFYFPTATPAEMKYLWVASRLPDEDMAAFTEAILGKTIPTAKGLDESADSFRG